MNVDNKTYWIEDKNYNRTPSTKTQIVIGTSMRKDHNHIIRLKHKDFSKTKKWNTFTISRSGEVFQHYDHKYSSNFLGIPENDKQSISIVLENMGNLYELHDGVYINWINEICDEENVGVKNFQGNTYWEKFTDEQIESCVELCNSLCKEHVIEKSVIEFQYYHKDIYKYDGITFRSNHISDSSDINPLFNISEFENKIKKMNEFNEVEFMASLVGKSKGDVEEMIIANNYVLRVTREDSHGCLITMDFRLDRINVQIDDGIITGAHIG